MIELPGPNDPHPMGCSVPGTLLAHVYIPWHWHLPRALALTMSKAFTE